MKIGANGTLILDYTELALTTADQLLETGNNYSIDFSGATANRIIELPSGYAGAVMDIYIDVPDDTYTLTIQGDGGVSIDGGTAAAAWATISTIGGQHFRFEWYAENDVRCIERPKRIATVYAGASAFSISTDDVWTKITTFDNVETDIFGLWDTTNERFNLPPGNYMFAANVLMGAALADNGDLKLAVGKNATTYYRCAQLIQGGTTIWLNLVGHSILNITSLSDYYELFLRKGDDTDTSRDTGTGTNLRFTVFEL